MRRILPLLIAGSVALLACGGSTAPLSEASFQGTYRAADSLVAGVLMPIGSGSLTLSKGNIYRWEMPTGTIFSAGQWEAANGILTLYDTTEHLGGWIGSPNVVDRPTGRRFSLELTDNERFYEFTRTR